MSLPFIQLHEALYQRLSTDAALLSLFAAFHNETGVYDSITTDTPYPYVMFDNPTLDMDAQVKVETIVNETIYMHVWHDQKAPDKEGYEYSGNGIPYRIIEAVYNALRTPLVMPDYKVLQVRPREPRVFSDIDERYKHGVIGFTFKLQRI